VRVRKEKEKEKVVDWKEYGIYDLIELSTIKSLLAITY